MIQDIPKQFWTGLGIAFAGWAGASAALHQWVAAALFLFMGVLGLVAGWREPSHSDE